MPIDLKEGDRLTVIFAPYRASGGIARGTVIRCEADMVHVSVPSVRRVPVRRSYPFHALEEGTRWLRGWSDETAHALLAAHALDGSSNDHVTCGECGLTMTLIPGGSWYRCACGISISID